MGGFRFTGVSIDLRLHSGAARLVRTSGVDINDVIVQCGELGLGEERQKMVVAAMTVDDQDFLAAIARHFIGGFLQEFELQFGAISEGAGLVFGFEDLAVEISWKDDGEFLGGGVFGEIAHIDEVGAEG